MRPMDTCRMKFDWGTRLGWSVSNARHTGACGFRWSIMPVIRFPARRPKHWYWRLKSAVGSVPNGVLNYCKSGLKTLSKPAHLPRNGYPASRWHWQPQNRPKQMYLPSFRLRKKRRKKSRAVLRSVQGNVSRCWSVVVGVAKRRWKLPGKS